MVKKRSDTIWTNAVLPNPLFALIRGIEPFIANLGREESKGERHRESERVNRKEKRARAKRSERDKARGKERER